MASSSLRLAALAALLALIAPAMAQQCPSKQCESYFANALGGPVDCCNHDYSKGKCSWGGTPVSWSKVSTCNSGGANYLVLTQSNSQAPPSGEQCRCKGAMPGGGSMPTTKPVQNLSPLSVCVTLTPRYDVDLQGADVQCDGQSYCKVCGGVDAVKGACLSKPRCVAFTFEQATGCGYLKTSADSRNTRAGWVSFTRG